MRLPEISALREVASWRNIMWCPDGPNGDIFRVVNIPRNKVDPDETGLPYYAAMLKKGHVDLSNSDINDFMVLHKIFENT